MSFLKPPWCKMGLRFAQPEVVPMQAPSPSRGGNEQLAIRCTFMRGGSSRGGVFLDSDLPQDKHDRDAVLLAAYGSPDDRQIDGIGGADPLTSKAAVVKLSEREDADVEYTFYQVGIDNPSVSTGGNCGNMLAAVGPFAIRRGLIPAVEPETVVRIYTTNTRQVVTARIPGPGWRAALRRRLCDRWRARHRRCRYVSISAIVPVLSRVNYCRPAARAIRFRSMVAISRFR